MKKGSKGRFFAPDKLENRTYEGKKKRKRKKGRERKEEKRKKKKAMVVLLVFNMA